MGFLLLGGLFGFFAVTVGLRYPSVPAGDIALVRDTVLPPGQLSKKNFQRTWKQTWLGEGLQKPPVPGSFEYKSLRRNAINDMLDRAWLIAEAEERDLRLPKGAVAKELRRIRFNQFPSNTEYRDFLKESGFNKQEVRERVYLQLLSQKLQVDLVQDLNSPTQEDVIGSYKENPQLYASPERREYQIIIIRVKDFARDPSLQEKILSASSKKEFKDLSRRYSVPRSDVPDSLPSQVATRLSSYYENEIGGPVASGPYLYFFQITDVIPGEVPDIESNVQRIQEEIVAAQTQLRREQFILDYEEKWRYRTFCQEGFVVSRCRNAPSRLRALGQYPGCVQSVEERARVLFLFAQGLPLSTQKEFTIPEEYIQQAEEQELICPPPVLSRRPMPPGGNTDLTLAGDYLEPFLPQGPLSLEGGTLPSQQSPDETLYSGPLPEPANPYRPNIQIQQGLG